MCGGGGPSGPSAEQLRAQEEAAAARAKAEADKINAQRELEKQAENAKIVAGQAEQANLDARRRIRNRTLLSGLDQEEGFGLEDPTSKSVAKAKRATLLGGI